MRIVVALGGNALLRRGEPMTPEAQHTNVRVAAQALADLARALALPRSSLHGLLATLVHLDLARRDDHACFRPGARPVQWAGAWNAQAEVVASFQRQAHALAALELETVMLAALDGHEVVYLDCRPGQRSLEINFRVGGRLPAAIASSGKAMLASLTDTQIRERLKGHPFERITRHSVASMTALLRQLRTVRETGYAVDDEEAAQGMLCLGAAVNAHDPHSAARPAAVASAILATSARPRGPNSPAAAQSPVFVQTSAPRTANRPAMAASPVLLEAAAPRRVSRPETSVSPSVVAP